MDILNDDFQLWNLSNESCPKETIPIRRTTEEDISRAGSIDSFGKKANGFRTDTTQNGHLVCNHRNLYILSLKFFFFNFSHFFQRELSLNSSLLVSLYSKVKFIHITRDILNIFLFSFLYFTLVSLRIVQKSMV